MNKLVVFQSEKIRRAWHEDEWFYSVVDVRGALTQSPDSGVCWRKLKQCLKQEGSEPVIICHGLKVECFNLDAILSVGYQGQAIRRGHVCKEN